MHKIYGIQSFDGTAQLRLLLLSNQLRGNYCTGQRIIMRLPCPPPEQRLARSLFASWPRRGASLLQMGLGVDPAFFWQAGFDVSVHSPQAEELARMQAEKPAPLEYSLGPLDHSHYEDNSFDYAALLFPSALLSAYVPSKPSLLDPSPTDPLEAYLKEALRVAQHGVMVMDWNVFSLASLSLKLPGKCARKGLTPWKLYQTARKFCPGGSISLRSLLPSPPLFWGKKFILPPLPLPMGAFVGLRLNCSPFAMSPVDAVLAKTRPAYSQEALLTRQGSMRERE